MENCMGWLAQQFNLANHQQKMRALRECVLSVLLSEEKDEVFFFSFKEIETHSLKHIYRYLFVWTAYKSKQYT